MTSAHSSTTDLTPSDDEDIASSPTLSLTDVQAGVQITRDNYSWGTTLGVGVAPVTFGFRTSAPSYDNGSDDLINTFSSFTSAEMTAARTALALWASIANISFTDDGSTNAATIEFANYTGNDGSEAFAYFPSGKDRSAASSNGDVFVNLKYASTTNDLPGTYEFQTFIHEIGHTLGLEHPGNYNAAAGVSITYQNNAAYIQDDYQYSVMSYFSETNTGANFFGTSPQTPMIDDIQALQRLYGANTTTRTGNTTYGYHITSDISAAFASIYSFSLNTHPVYCIYDAGGINTLDCSGYSGAQTIDLHSGGFSSVLGLIDNISIADNTLVQIGIGGSGNDTLISGASGDTLTGGGGNNTFAGTIAAITSDAITDFNVNDRIHITDFGYGGQATGSLTSYNVSTGILTISSSGTKVSFTVHGSLLYNNFLVTNDGSSGIYVTLDTTPISAPRIIQSNDLSYSSTASGYNHFIDYLNFVASFSDLTHAFGTNQSAASAWYNSYEPTERRVETFDGLDYIASYSDLIGAFGSGGSLSSIQDMGASHFITNGLSEGRSTTFNGLDYIASYGDLISALGANNDAGAYHYIEHGTTEGRTTTFDGLDYIASYGDLINAFGTNEQAGAAHYINHGVTEGRHTTFDGLAYIAQYTDLMNAFGANNDAGAAHYIQHGYSEGRSMAFNVSAYESAHTDLIGKYASNDAFLAAYITTFKTTGTLLT